MMHDCHKIEERFVDLIFNEVTTEQRAEILAEVESCSSCRVQVESYKATLAMFGDAAKLMMPEENYWNGYERRLRSRLAEEERPVAKQRWFSAIGEFFRQPAWALATIALILVALFIWSALRPSIVSNEASSIQSNSVNPASIVAESLVKQEPKPGIQQPGESKEQTKPIRAGSRNHDERQGIAGNIKPKANESRQPEAPASLTTEAQASLIASAIDAETIKHFEKTQMLLRSFRNLPADHNAASVEIADERERSRALLFQNILLRREANVKGVAPVEEVLNNVEPVLIDIANLPDKAPPAEIRAIRERIQRREIVATLQIYLTKPAIVGTITE
jgi:hypothetical protein